MTRRTRRRVLLALLALGACEPSAGPEPPQGPAEFVGSTACAACHQEAFDAWAPSQHALAMQQATDSTVLGDFEDARFTAGGVTSTFYRAEGRFMVRTDGPDGRLADFEITHTFGVFPLQQYLIPTGSGRYQALGIAWDSRSREAYGQRWFHLYPEAPPRAGDPLHWTGYEQTWNYQCADCHSTNLRKGYDADRDAYTTTWSEISVGCEACHGPGSRHLTWAGQEPDARATDGDAGLVVILSERRGVTWIMNTSTGTARRSSPRPTDREIEVCARCHARRGQLTDRVTAADHFTDGFRPALLTTGLYHPDGQMEDEVYNYASFLQSRMYAAGVTCSDCHEPHSYALRAPGDRICVSCHLVSRFDTPAHHFHEPGTSGADCRSCHMKTETYMVVDPRHDHSFRVPRPDRAVAFGVPEPCTTCHTDQTPGWAGAEIRARAGRDPVGFQTFAETFARFDDGQASPREVLSVATDLRQPAVVRASALDRLAGTGGQSGETAIRRALYDPSPLVREAAVRVVADAEPGIRGALLAPLLTDSSRLVRSEAARVLARSAEALQPEDRPRFASAWSEWVAGMEFAADRPEARANLGTALSERGDGAGASRHFRAAIALDSTYTPAWVNLAEHFRASGQEDSAERILRDGLRINPSDAALHHALGLGLVRQQRSGAALEELRQAARLAPGNSRFAYVYAVALQDTGERASAIRVLERAVAGHPFDHDLLFALALFHRDAGRVGEALGYARRLAELNPADPGPRRLVSELEGR